MARITLALVLMALAAACGSDDTAVDPVDAGDAEPRYAVGGTVDGLTGELVLGANGAVALISADGAFTIDAELADGADYSVFVYGQPLLQLCTVADGRGTVAGADVGGVTVTCASDDTSLASLAVSSLTAPLAPIFDPDLTVYIAATTLFTSSVSVTATAASPAATITVRGQVLVAGTPSLPIAMNPGNNAIVVEVTAPSGRARTYVVLLDRSTALLSSHYAKVYAPDTNDWFGAAVAASGDTVVVGAIFEDSNAVGVNGNQADNSLSNSGAAYVFVRTGATWAQQAYLKASNTGTGDLFGGSVAISGDTIVVGALGEASSATGVNNNQSDNTLYAAGAAYVFTRTGTTWSQQAYLKASNTRGDHQFGIVAISGDTIVVGALHEDSNATGVGGNQADESMSNAGSAYVFTRTGVAWSQQAYLKASNTDAGDRFGWSVAIAGDTVAIGAQNEDSNATGINGNQADDSTSSAGAAYVFTRTGTTWSQQAYLKASNTGADDTFGYTIAASGDTVVVGAPDEDSSSAGVGGDQTSNGSVSSGAAYVFTRSGTTWSQQAYLKASNARVVGYFSYGMAISGDTIVIGAYGDASSAVGSGGDQSSVAAPNAGAAHVFTRAGAVWTHDAYLKASNTQAYDVLGWAVALAGDTVVATAMGEDSLASGIGGNQADNSAGDSGAMYLFR